MKTIHQLSRNIEKYIKFVNFFYVYTINEILAIFLNLEPGTLPRHVMFITFFAVKVWIALSSG